MSEGLMLPGLKELARLNGETAAYGLTLTEGEARGLIARKNEALLSAGRVEFSAGILPALIRGFCDSPYIQKEDYAQTLGLLLEIFYDFKNDLETAVSDEELIEWMRAYFDGPCGGETEVMRDATAGDVYRCALRARG